MGSIVFLIEFSFLTVLFCYFSYILMFCISLEILLVSEPKSLLVLGGLSGTKFKI